MELDNPLKRVRKNNGLTLASMAGKVGIHTQAIYLNERGVYPTILPATHRWLERQGYDAKGLQLEYLHWQKEHRWASGVTLYARQFELGAPDSNSSPFTLFLGELGLSRMKFAKMLACHPALLYRLEQGVTLGIGLQVRHALTDAGFSENMINELDSRVEEFGSRNSSYAAFRAAT